MISLYNSNITFILHKLKLILIMSLRQISVIICLIYSWKMYSQEMLYHVNIASPLSFNPAYAGNAFDQYTNKSRLFMGIQQNEFQRTNGFFMSFDLPIDKLRGGVGLIIDQQSIANSLITKKAIKGIYNYVLPFNKNLYVRWAIQPGYENKILDETKLNSTQSISNLGIHPSFYDSALQNKNHNNNRDYFTIGSGILIETPKLEFGFALQNINRPNWSFSDNVIVKKAMQTIFHVQYKVYNKEKFEVYAKTMLNTQLSAQLFNIGLQLKSKHWMFGFSYNQYQSIFHIQDYVLGTFAYTADELQLRYSYELQLFPSNTAQIFNQSIGVQYQFSAHTVKGCRFFRPRSQFLDLSF